MVVSLIALFVALSGAAYAVVKPGKNTVGPKQVKNDSLTGNEIAPDSLEGVDIDENTLSLPASAAPSGPAGGDLSGNYPSPAIGNNAVNAAKIADGTVNTAEIADNAVNAAKVADNSLGGADVNESTLALGAEAWHVIGETGEPPFDEDDANFCTFKNYENGFNPAAFARDSAGFVHLRGLVDAEDTPGSSGCDFSTLTDLIIFTLPPGYRPANTELFINLTNSAVGRITVTTGGVVHVEGPTTEANAKEWVQLDGLTFRCAPSGADGCP